MRKLLQLVLIKYFRNLMKIGVNMKDLLKRLKSFFTLDLLVDYDDLILRFRQTHQQRRGYISNWPTEATYWYLISDYWENVLKHYLAMLAVSIILINLFSFSREQFTIINLFILVLTGFMIYFPVYFMIYRPTFNREFVPRLTAVMAEFEGKERLNLEKCKQAQMSNTALSIVFYVLARTSGIQLKKIDTQFGGLLMNLFGSSPDSLQKALKLISCKVTSLTPHKQTELEKSLEEARTFFTELEFPQGLEIIGHLERKFRRL